MNVQKAEIVEDSPKRQAIIRTAYEAFYKHGFHATGVDTLLADSGISKRTLYKYFRSKEELITATVAYYHQHTLEAITAALAACPGGARDKLLALFDLRRDILAAGDFSGCLAINAKLEYEGKHAGIETACADFLDTLEAAITGLCRDAGVAPAHLEMAARQLMILIEGTIVYGQSRRDPRVAEAARQTAAMLLDSLISAK